MFGSEFENIKEYKPIEPESEIREIEKINKIKENLIVNSIKLKSLIFKISKVKFE